MGTDRMSVLLKATMLVAAVALLTCPVVVAGGVTSRPGGNPFCAYCKVTVTSATTGWVGVEYSFDRDAKNWPSFNGVMLVRGKSATRELSASRGAIYFRAYRHGDRRGQYFWTGAVRVRENGVYSLVVK